MGLSHLPAQRARPVRLAVPGVIWGHYPQGAETDGRPPLRRHPLARPGRLAARAMAMAADPIGVNQARAALLREGLGDHAVAQALACCAQKMAHVRGLRPHPEQLRTAAALLGQQLVEMATGEGKTLAAALAAGVAAMTGAPVHLLTANDYLAERDAHQHQDYFAALGLSCAVATASMSVQERRQAYQADVCYGTARTVAFDYLRDQPLLEASWHGEPATPMLRGLCFAILDEADNLLLDEANMPLVLAEQVDDPLLRPRLWQTLDLARRLCDITDYVVDPASRTVRLTREGRERIELLAIDYASHWINARHRDDLVLQALRALHLLRRDVEYMVREREIVLVDAITGRAAEGRQLPGELHGLVAAKEGLPPPALTRAGSGLTYPRLFARYHHLSGLSGTLAESRAELRRLYGLRVHRAPRHRRNLLRIGPTRCFDDRDALFRAAVQQARRIARGGRPVLIGTDCIEDSLLLQRFFAGARQAVNLLNAANDADEARGIALAGIGGQITISTQIAGRGTDIVCDATALAHGGLHVLNLQHNRSRRIDRQMIGRAARQGDPGSAEHWIRLRGGPLEPERLPAGLRLPCQLLARLGLAGALLRYAQTVWGLEDRLQRKGRLSSDRKWSRQLHFSSMSRQ